MKTEKDKLRDKVIKSLTAYVNAIYDDYEHDRVVDELATLGADLDSFIIARLQMAKIRNDLAPKS